MVGPHVSPSGEAKCVRGPSGQGASQAEEKGVSRPTPRVKKHETRPLPVHQPSDISSGANQAPSMGFHETRDTRHETRLSRFSRITAFTGSPALRHFFWSEPGLVDGFSRNTRHETRITAFTVFTKHETRITNHGFYVFNYPQPSARQGQPSLMSSRRRAPARPGSSQGRRVPGNNSAPGSRA